MAHAGSTVWVRSIRLAPRDDAASSTTLAVAASTVLCISTDVIARCGASASELARVCESLAVDGDAPPQDKGETGFAVFAQTSPYFPLLPVASKAQPVDRGGEADGGAGDRPLLVVCAFPTGTLETYGGDGGKDYHVEPERDPGWGLFD
jgi:hypothetical protein